MYSLQAFAQLLQAPRDDADAIIKERFPVPRLVICDQHGSQVIVKFSTNVPHITVLHSDTRRVLQIMIAVQFDS